MTRKEIGSFGEQVATDWLKRNGYAIIERNFRCKAGEIDIIASKEGFLCFVEVKTRSEGSMGRPVESVTRSKQQKIIKTTEYYIVRHPSLVEREGLQPRFDCIEVFANSEGRPVAYEYIKNAFTAN